LLNPKFSTLKHATKSYTKPLYTIYKTDQVYFK